MPSLVKCSLAHEINNLLTVILAHADSLSGHCSSSTPARKHLEAILLAAHRLSNSVYCHECNLHRAGRQAEDHRDIALAAGD